MAPRLDKLSSRAGSAYQQFLQQYPQIPVTSAYRDPSYNAKVGGAKGSAHMHGDALDFSMRGLDDAQKAEVVDWWRGQGATGIGFYPNSDSIHVDMREGPNRAWGPNYSHTSLDQTPDWFRSIASEHRGAPSPAPSGGTISGQGGSDMAVGGSGNDDLSGAMPQQQGGLGGLGGFFNKPETRDLIQAMGLSMMSSPRNNWLANTGQYLPGIQDRREKREETTADREATEAALRSAGFTAEEAKAYSRNPQAANLALDAKALQRDEAEKARTFQANNAYRDSLMGGTQPMAGGYDAPAAEPTRAAQAGPGPALLQPGSLTDAMPEQIPATQAPAPQAAAQPNRTLQFRDQLYAENDRLYQQAVRAENPQQRQAAELAIKANEAKIGRINDLVGEPPKIAERFNEETGQPEKVIFNRDTGGWEPFGGQKVPSSGITVGPDGSVQIGGPVKMTEAVRRNQQLYSVIEPELATVKETFGALSSLGEQAAAGAFGPASNFVTSPEYQMGRNSLQTIISSYLYSVSGATANPGEVATQTDMLLPKPGEDPQTTAQKLRRIETMVKAVGLAAGIQPGGAETDDQSSSGGGSGGSIPRSGGGANRTTNGLSWSVN